MSTAPRPHPENYNTAQKLCEKAKKSCLLKSDT